MFIWGRVKGSFAKPKSHKTRSKTTLLQDEKYVPVRLAVSHTKSEYSRKQPSPASHKSVLFYEGH